MTVRPLFLATTLPPVMRFARPFASAPALLGAGLAAALLLASGCGGGSDSSVGPGPDPSVAPVHFVGQAVDVGAASPAGLRFFARRDAQATQEYTAPLDASGAFQLDVALPGAGTDSLTLAVDETAGGGPRTVRPVIVRATRGTAPTTLRPLLVPRAVALPTTSSYAGVTQAVSLRDAFTPVCTAVNEANCNSFFPRDWLTGVEVWAASSLPIPLAFNRAGSIGTIDASDSAAFWFIVQNMERDLGRPLFRPATITELAAPDSTGYSSGAVLVSIDPTLGATSGYTNWIYTANRDVVAARSRFGSASVLASSSLVTHELLHALGFHHTCAWPSVMGGYGCQPTFRASVGDVAGFTLAYQVRTAQVSGTPTTGLAEARAGELTLELGAVAARPPVGSVEKGLQATRVPAGVTDASSRPRVVGGTRVREAGAP